MQALGTGRLVPDARSGLGLGVGAEVLSVIWPFEYSAVSADGTIWLVDPAGVPVASLGDMVEMSGGSGDDGLWYACAGTIKRIVGV
jgi:hypothetical protein